MIGLDYSTYLYCTSFLHVVQHGFSSSYHQRADHVARHPSPKGASMEWSRVPGNQKKKKKRNPLHLHLVGRCDLFWKTPPSPIQKRKSPELHACKVCFSATHRKYSTIRRNWRKRGFAHSARLFFSFHHDGRILFLEGGSERPEDGPTTGKFNYWQMAQRTCLFASLSSSSIALWLFKYRTVYVV